MRLTVFLISRLRLCPAVTWLERPLLVPARLQLSRVLVVSTSITLTALLRRRYLHRQDPSHPAHLVFAFSYRFDL